MEEIKNRVLKQELVDWRNLEWIQGQLKDLTEEGFEKLIKSIVENNIVKAFHVWENEGKLYCLDGNHLKKALEAIEKRKLKKVPGQFKADFIDCKDMKEAKQLVLIYSAVYAKITDEGLYDFLHSSELIDDWDLFKGTLEIPGIDMEGFELGWLKDDVLGMGESGEDDFDVDKAVGEIKQPISKLGDLWILGRHRLLCGDATKKEDVERLMGGKKADMVFTDPPYGVDYASKNEFLNEYDKGNKIQTDIINDVNSQDAFDLWGNAFEVMNGYLNKVSSIYICSPQSRDLMMMMMMIQKGGFYISSVIIWVKNNHVLGRQDYFFKHEPIIYGWLKKGTHKFYGKGNCNTTVWNFDKSLKNDLHPTMKPIPLIIETLLNSSLVNQIIFDNFLGSGSTLIACEQTNRICYGLEIEPLYCDVIIKRWQEFSKQESVREDGKKFNELVQK